MAERLNRYIACDIDMTLQAGDWHPELKTEADRSLDVLVDAIESERQAGIGSSPFFGAVSGRTIESQRKEVEQKSDSYKRAVKKMNILIGSVGAEMALRKGDRFVPASAWPGKLSGWDRKKAQHKMEVASDFGELELQGDMTQSANKLSYFVEAKEKKPGEYAKKVEAYLGKAGVKATVIYSGNRFLDILPRLASGKEVDKGAAVKFGARLLADEYHLSEEPKVVFAGDSENDEAAIDYAISSGGNAIIPGNAKKEFKRRMQKEYSKKSLYVATTNLASGVYEGLRHFEVLAPN